MVTCGAIFINKWRLKLKGRNSVVSLLRYCNSFHEVRRNRKFSMGIVQGDSFGTRPKKMRISQRLFIRFWTCIYDYIPCFMKSMPILEEMMEMFATTVQAELNATLHVCESGRQDVPTNRRNFTSNVVFQFLYGAWLVGISFSFYGAPQEKNRADLSQEILAVIRLSK